MNLSELLDRVGVDLRHDPASISERNNRAAVLNDEYQRLCSEQRWSFLQKTQKIRHYPGVDITDTITIEQYRFIFVLFRANDIRYADQFESAEITWDSLAGYEPRPFVYGDTPGVGGGSICTYDNPYAGVGPVSMTIHVQPRIMIPGDCIEVLGVMSRDDDRGPLEMTDLATEHALMLNEDEYGDPVGYMVDPPQQIDRSPYAAPVVTEVAGTSAFTVGQVYRYFYAYWTGGRYSGRSAIASVTCTVATNAHSIGGLEAWAGTARGTERHLFRAEGLDGPFRYVTYYRYTDVFPKTLTSSYVPDEDRPWVDPSPYQYLRLWPNPARDEVDCTGAVGVVNYSPTFTEYELRYRYRPPRLQHDLDVPHLPIEFHDVLVFRTVERMAMQRDDKVMAAYAERAGREKLSLMKRRYLTTTAQKHKMRDWTNSLAGARWTKPTITRNP